MQCRSTAEKSVARWSAAKPKASENLPAPCGATTSVESSAAQPSVKAHGSFRDEVEEILSVQSPAARLQAAQRPEVAYDAKKPRATQSGLVGGRAAPRSVPSCTA